MATTFTHVGIAVKDREESRRFYTEALGFVPTGGEIRANDDDDVFPGISTFLEVDDTDVIAEFFTNGPQTIELVTYTSPGTQGEPERRPMNKLGLTHLCFLVEDVDAVAAKVEECGGRILEFTRMEHDRPDGINRDYLFCTDPNGVRIELINASRLPNADQEAQLVRRA
jgi:catechol 2,3-dioxygenase-like lactoylglutathione lyase family enzyme